MANIERRRGEELTDERAPRARARLPLIGVAVLLPVGLAAMVSVALYATRPPPPLPTPATSPGASDSMIRDGPLLILQPETEAPISIPAGQELEVVLPTGAGQTVTSTDSSVLAPIANPPCDVPSLCGIPGSGAWTFRGVRPGAARLEIVFGARACAGAGSCAPVTALVKPVTVIGGR